MFDEPPSLPMRAAIASLLGSLFGVALILFTHSAEAQTPAAEPAAPPTAAIDISSGVARLGDAALRVLRSYEGAPAPRNLRISDSGEAGSGMRWQLARSQGLRSDGDIPRSRDLVSFGVQVRF